MSDPAPYSRSVRLRSRSVTWNGSRAGSGTRSVTDCGPGASRTGPTAPPGAGVPAGSGITSAALTQATALRDSWSRTWSFHRPDSTATVPVGKNQLYVPCGTARPGVMLSVVPVPAVSSFRTTTPGNVISTSPTVSGQRALAESPPAVTTSEAHAVRPSAHRATAGSQPAYRPTAAEGGRRSSAGSRTNARSMAAGAWRTVSGTNGTLVPHGSTRRTDAPGAASTLNGIPSPAGRSTRPVGRKLVVSIHAARPGDA